MTVSSGVLRRMAALAAIGTALLIGGCATTAPPALTPGLISGRLALQVGAFGDDPARQLSGSFELRGDASRGQLDLTGPLGVTVAQARWVPGRVELSSADGPMVFANLQDLSRQAFGEPLPLAALFDWLRGRPWPDAPANATPDGFVQLGWQVDTSKLAEGQFAARRASAVGAPTVMLRARLEPPS